MPENTFNITVIGWWAGTFNVLYGLKTYHDDSLSERKNLAAIIAMTDSGGTTWQIRDKFGVLPPGDLRRAVAALARDTWLVRELFEYKFDGEEWVIGGNKMGNILMTALADIKGDFEAWLDEMCKMFDVHGKVIPVTLEDVQLWVHMDDGTRIIGEKNIDVSEKNPGAKSHNADQNIHDAFLVGWEWNLNPRARDAITHSDLIVIGPGDFYTSVIPNLLSKGIWSALANSSAKIVYVANIMADRWETTHYELRDFIENIEKYAWEIIDYVLVNSWNISEENVQKYREEEWKKPVKFKETEDFSQASYKVIERDFVNESDVVRHDPKKLAATLIDICRGWIK